ncbi:MAG TPA: 1,4-alpha-glucan branching enzyme, partial [Thioalkalivibrio sp.]|nr:1,4-alpha-glucan branching enzyme [Thioalkalivibrio sp.]
MKAHQDATRLADDDLRRLVDARHHDPFSVLGRHGHGELTTVRAFLPHARDVRIAELDAPLERIDGTDLFEWRGDAGGLPARYRLRWEDHHGAVHERHDPYAFPAAISNFDLHLFGEGRHWHIYRVLGAHPCVIDDVPGVRFAVWAPNA